MFSLGISNVPSNVLLASIYGNQFCLLFETNKKEAISAKRVTDACSNCTGEA
jgi:hypothetical protein